MINLQKEIVLQAIEKEEFYIADRHNQKETISRSINTEFGCIDIKVALYFSDDLESVVDVWCEELIIFDEEGEEIYLEITDNEIKEVLI